jgi:hypothetical protein
VPVSKCLCVSKSRRDEEEEVLAILLALLCMDGESPARRHVAAGDGDVEGGERRRGREERCSAELGCWMDVRTWRTLLFLRPDGDTSPGLLSLDCKACRHNLFIYFVEFIL